MILLAVLAISGTAQTEVSALRAKLSTQQTDAQRAETYWQLAKVYSKDNPDSSLANFRKARFLAGIVANKAIVAEITSDMAGMLLDDQHPYAAQVLLSQVAADDLPEEARNAWYMRLARVQYLLCEPETDTYAAALLNTKSNTPSPRLDELLVRSWLAEQDTVSRAALAARMTQYMSQAADATHAQRWMRAALLQHAQLSDSARVLVNGFVIAEKTKGDSAAVADWYVQLMRLDKGLKKGDSLARHCDSMFAWLPSAQRMELGYDASHAALAAANAKLALRITDSLLMWSASPYDAMRTAQMRLRIYRALGDVKNELVVMQQLYELRDQLVKEEFRELSKQWLNESVNVERQVQHLQQDNERSLSTYKVWLYAAAALALLLVVAAIIILVKHAARRAKWTAEIEALQERIAAGEETHQLEEEKLQRKEAEVKRKENESTKLRALVEQQEVELRRVGVQVGERLGEHLLSARTQLDAVRQSGNTISVEQFMQLQNAITKANKEIKALTDTLVPDSLEQRGLLEALRLLADKKQTASTKIMIEAQGKPFMLEHVQEVALYRICTEIIENALQHGDASAITVRLNYLDRELVLVAHDNGRGFDVNQSIPKGSGIKGIIARVTFLKGTLDIASETGNGTEYTIGVKNN